jgi:hypothetical protein
MVGNTSDIRYQQKRDSIETISCIVLILTNIEEEKKKKEKELGWLKVIALLLTWSYTGGPITGGSSSPMSSVPHN